MLIETSTLTTTLHCHPSSRSSRTGYRPKYLLPT